MRELQLEPLVNRMASRNVDASSDSCSVSRRVASSSPCCSCPRRVGFGFRSLVRSEHLSGALFHPVMMLGLLKAIEIAFESLG